MEGKMDSSAYEAAFKALALLFVVIIPTVVFGLGMLVGWMIWGG
jgi:hypothetical protein